MMKISTRLCIATAALLAMAAPGARAEPSTQICAPAKTFRIERYNANIESAPALDGVKPGDLVEFNPKSLGNPVAYMRTVKARGAMPEWYWGGGNCHKGPDCEALRRAGVTLGSTGTAEWDKAESRIDDLDHKAVVERASREMELALRAAARARSDLVFRVDNLHDIDDIRFYSRRHVRDHRQLAAIPAAWAAVVGRLRVSGVLKPYQLVGLTAHNNFGFWMDYTAKGGTPPLLLRIENPTQFGPEFARGGVLSRVLDLPYIAVEFKVGHLYPRPPTAEELTDIQSKVSVLLLLANEDNYIGGENRLGPGPRLLSSKATGKSVSSECPPSPK